MAKGLSSCWLTYSMEQSPSWKANRFSASQETTRTLWNPKFHYLFHKYPTSVNILSHLEAVHASISNFVKLDINITNLSTPGFSKWSLSQKFPQQNLVYVFPLPHTCPSSSILIRLDLITEKYWKCVQVIKVMQSSPFPYEAQIMSSISTSQTHCAGWHVRIKTVVEMYAMFSNMCSNIVDIPNTREVIE